MVGPRDVSVTLNHAAINHRILELDSLLQSTKYSKQKETIHQELVSFLSHLSPPRTLDDALPLDVRMFLIHKDATGKNTDT